jgi:lipid-A-disaccharide synthase-like uncharacterized protein
MMSSKTFWIGIGFAGQALFTARFVFQWLASERKRATVVPVAFWWFSLLGGVTLLVYAIHLLDPVIIVGQAMGLVVYVRNLMFAEKARRRAAKRRQRAERLAEMGSNSEVNEHQPKPPRKSKHHRQKTEAR